MQFKIKKTLLKVQIKDENFQEIKAIRREKKHQRE